jgi:hypothetical protein
MHPTSKTLDIEGHQERKHRASEEKEHESLQRVMRKLTRIEQSRQEVQERVGKEVELSRQ